MKESDAWTTTIHVLTDGGKKMHVFHRMYGLEAGLGVTSETRLVPTNLIGESAYH